MKIPVILVSLTAGFIIACTVPVEPQQPPTVAITTPVMSVFPAVNSDEPDWWGSCAQCHTSNQVINLIYLYHEIEGEKPWVHTPYPWDEFLYLWDFPDGHDF